MMNCLAQRKKFKNKHPAWSDPNDPKHNELSREADQEPEAEPKGSSSDEDDDDMYAGDVRAKKLTLNQRQLRFKHLLNINNDRSYKGGIQQVQFSPRSRLALISLRYGQADLFEVDGERNRYVQNIKLPHTNEPYCLFHPERDSIVISSESYNGTFYTYDMASSTINRYALKIGRNPKQFTDFIIHGPYMACRKEGSQDVHVLCSKTLENSFTIKINEPAKAIHFSSNNNDMYIAGHDAQVYIWDIRKASACRHKFRDEGSVHSTSMAISEASNMLSIGSDSGIVNTYELDQCMKNKDPRPIKTHTNLNTPVDILKYNAAGELLLIGSCQEMAAFRMIHTLSGTVYRNFPPQNKKYGRLNCADFSPLGGYLALGCSTGRAHLCRIPYYKSY